MENEKQKYDFKEEKIKSPIDGSDNCFKVYTEPATDEHYLCMNTGYMASSYFQMNNDVFQNEINNSPEIVKALQHYDEERDLIWIPSVLNMGPLGMIFPDGTLDSWIWKFAKNVDIPDEEQEKYPVPGKDGEFYKSKLDIENAEEFARNDFIGACTAMGVIKDGRLNPEGAVENAEVQS
tara:strand:- start:421 stop:957 length:537 start_codon:yes stop_codon:yes gene_type:complete